MKLLVVTLNYPFPPRTGSSIVAFNALNFLSKKHSINLVSFQPMVGLTISSEFVEHVDIIEHGKFSPLAKWFRYITYSMIGVPPSVSANASNAMSRKVKSEIEKGEFDAVIMFEMSAIQFIPNKCLNKLVVNIEDPQSIKLRRMIELPVWSLWQKAKLAVLTKLTESYENRVLNKVAKVLLLSEADVNDMRNNISLPNLAHVTYGVDQREFSEIMAYEDRDKVILFSGSMYHPPNVDGALFFIREIFPLILQAHQTAKLRIVGAAPDGRIYEAAARYGKHIEITGTVTNMSEYIKRAAVSVCPVRLKIGVQTKVLEALSWGTPTVSTSAGNSGINGVSGTHLWVEDDPHMFAKRVCDLLHGSDWKRLSVEGRRLVAASFTWEASSAQLEQYLIDVAAMS